MDSLVVIIGGIPKLCLVKVGENRLGSGPKRSLDTMIRAGEKGRTPEYDTARRNCLSELSAAMFPLPTYIQMMTLEYVSIQV